jgi:predicted nucleotidyltransferase
VHHEHFSISRSFDYDSGDEVQLLRDFIANEDNGINSITIDMAGDSVIVTSLREVPTDSLTGANGEVLKYSKQIVLKDFDAVKEALSYKNDHPQHLKIQVQIQPEKSSEK